MLVPWISPLTDLEKMLGELISNSCRPGCVVQLLSQAGVVVHCAAASSQACSASGQGMHSLLQGSQPEKSWFVLAPSWRSAVQQPVSASILASCCCSQVWRLLVETLQLLIAPLQWFLTLLAAFFTQPAPRHKRRSRRTRGGQGASRSASNAGWAYGRNSSNQVNWLVDCYRMRLEDDSDYGGGCARKLLTSSYSLPAGWLSESLGVPVGCGRALHADVVCVEVAGRDKVPQQARCTTRFSLPAWQTHSPACC